MNIYSKIINPVSGKLINVNDYEGYDLLNKGEFFATICISL